MRIILETDYTLKKTLAKICQETNLTWDKTLPIVPKQAPKEPLWDVTWETVLYSTCDLGNPEGQRGEELELVSYV